MTRTEFINYITSIGFEYNKYSYNYYYENYIIMLDVIHYKNITYHENYSLYNGKEYFYDIPFADLTYFIKIQRSIKLKKLLK